MAVPVVDAVPMAGPAAGRAVVPVVDAVPMAGPAAGRAVVPVVDAVPMAVPSAGRAVVPTVDVTPVDRSGGSVLTGVLTPVEAVPMAVPAAGLTAGRAIEAVQAAGSTTDPIWIVDAGGPTLQVPRVGAGWPGVAPAA